MAWDGYFEYAGTEIINVARTEAYALHAGMGSFNALYKNTSLSTLLLDDPYESPLQDDAPWVDPSVEDTYDFYGVYPLDIGGIEDSTWTGTVVENVNDGGFVSALRRGTRTVTFNVVLLGGTECAVEAGMVWLRDALSGMNCQASYSVPVANLCYFRCEPVLDPNVVSTTADLVACLSGYSRTLKVVTFTGGPQVTRKATTANGETAWTVQFTGIAADPYEWCQEDQIIAGFLDPAVAVPYVGGVVPAGGLFDLTGVVETEVLCPMPQYQPVNDPTCPFILPPAALPQVTLSCFTFPTTYRRRKFVIPADRTPRWGGVVPLIQIRTPFGYEVRNLRLRFYTDVLASGSPSNDPCNFCGDILFSYIPPNTTLIFDGGDQQVYLQDLGGPRRRADSLVYGSDGSPFEWPELACGVPYVVTIDMPSTAPTPVIDMTLLHRVT